MNPADREMSPQVMTEESEEHKIFGLGIDRADQRQPTYGLGVVVSLLTAAAVLVLAVIAVGEGEAQDPPILEVADRLFWVISGTVIFIAAVGSQIADRMASRAAQAVGNQRSGSAMATAWAAPMVAAFASVVLVGTYHNRLWLICGPLIAFVGTAGALLSRDLLDDADEQSSRVAATIHSIVIHGIAFAAFTAIYVNKLSSWISAPLVGIVTLLLVLESLERTSVPAPRRTVYALLTGWVLAQTIIGLNWWPITGVVGGAVLLAVFYITLGLVMTATREYRIRIRDLAELGGVGIAALTVLAIFS